MAKDLYEILGVSHSATQHEIAAAFRRLAKKHHPDRNPGDSNSPYEFREIQAAYDVLRDKTKRKKYDAGRQRQSPTDGSSNDQTRRTHTVREPLITEPSPDDDRARDAALRPRRLSEVVGQRQIVKKLEIHVNACKKLKEPMGHILFDGPPGLGKTTFATVLPNELGTSIQMTSGPALSKPADMLPFLTNLEEGSILFIDEIHRMPRVVEEFIYPAMEDFRVDIVLGEGLNARTISMPLKRFTLIGATTRSGMLSGPMRDRFRMHEHLEFYSIDELAKIIEINAKKLSTEIDRTAAEELAARSRGTPRVANSRLHWVRSYSASESDGRITLEIARAALELAEVDPDGLDKQDRRYLETLVGVFEGGPAGVEAIAATMNLPSDTLADEVEPYLLREQYVIRTSRGRVATPRAFQKLGKLPKPDPDGPTLFEG